VEVKVWNCGESFDGERYLVAQPRLNLESPEIVPGPAQQVVLASFIVPTLLGT
jgi:hypothetical protein